MKNIFKLAFIGIIGIFIFHSCETTELDLTENPNALSPEQADVDFFLNSVQLRYAAVIDSLGEDAGGLVRLSDFQFRNYLNSFGPNEFDREWEAVYREILADIRAMEPLAQENEQFLHLGIANVIEADVMTSLVDFFGDIPYTEAITALSEANFNPKLDSGASIYEAAIGLLDQAISNFNRDDFSAEPAIDFYYDGDYDKWIKLANTLKMKLYLQSRLVDATAISKFNAIVASGNYITSSADDFQFQWRTNPVQPDTRHPNYAQNYAPTGAGDYVANWLVNEMQTSNDPRLRYYFYRQTNAVPGQAGAPPNEEQISCSLETPPQHYIDGGFTFCGLPNGYWGRDHGDNDGIPPDGLLRTAHGVYPAGGMFDDNRFSRINQGFGAQGAGITPIMLASWVDFMKAEVAMLTNPVNGRADLLAGVEKSVTKVLAFGPLDATADESFFATPAEVTAHSTAVATAFDAATNDGKWNIMAQQYWIAGYGNGIGNWNFYRRTGFPTTLQPNREPLAGAGGFIRSFRYPASAANNNTNIQQRQSVTTQVFWDTNPPSPGFPIAN
ncbi:SusD/RagB family nutrient-binding outer membrane lipoprotein [Arenibacter sp. GZD96]|uniref:SusD/RagB family nutrient-binding outer membrane lipoprotein n=1 Tax=Aurantibrevibacter litoralis TaxID=3106030 RepID=UPI002B001A46|nr:SusD/RagB family nutrient-binding outer membrane lipoprotein [Arenibacter sp. GZD-96]MEA1785897.1 SusD/RagB family nutrient-binding outer membrane lipoprotein [Arenibacter sp. GZD-96]